MAVILISYDYYLARKELFSSAKMIANATVMELDKEFSVVQSALMTLSTSPSISHGDLEAFQVQAIQVAAQQDVLNIVLEDSTGRQILNTLKPFLRERYLAREITSPISLGGGKEMQVSDLFQGPIARQLVVAVSIPVSAGKNPYFLSAGVTPKRFEQILSLQKFKLNWIVAILDSSGAIVARSHDMSRFVGKKVPPNTLAAIRNSPEEAVELTSIDGVPMVAVTASSGKSGWFVAIGIPQEYLRSELNRKFWFLIFSSTVLMGVGLIFSLHIGNNISQAIRELVTPALEIGGEKVIPHKVFSIQEANEVWQALFNTSKMLQSARYQARHDSLTGLANRALFCEFLEQQMEICTRNQSSLSLLYVDIDNFKKVNDTHGHATGDELLIAVSNRLKSVLRKSDIAARLGGDEFAIVLIDADNENAKLVAIKLSANLEDSYYLGNQLISASASIGVSSFPSGCTDSQTLLLYADEDMYRVKSSRRENTETSTSIDALKIN
ncbi:diguanylate cyclase [Duganella sp. FT135W]|uniref:Diguanylate cyclase n=1 Tax=Duganella flavida TaxID=2692175 RepID=A0A6L8KPD8_9BURK|nr:sensor domain-containing diguanylate cyclase [Duganella flavida]MYM26411.1 diguanylate cyclase [Duganella flavida]